MRKKYLIIALLAASIMLLGGIWAGAQSSFNSATTAQPPTATPASQYQAYGIEPNPLLNTNVTWSTFYQNWTTLQYQSGANVNDTSILPTALNPAISNPISVNPSDIQSSYLQGDKLGTLNTTWDSATWTTGTYGAYGQVATSTVTYGHAVLTANESDSGQVHEDIQYTVSSGNYPSQNIAYDYLTIILGLSGTPGTGADAGVGLWNSSAAGVAINSIQITPGEIGYVTIPLSQIGIGFNTTIGKGYSNLMNIQPYENLPKSSADLTYTLTIYGLAFTTTPYYLGMNNSNGIIAPLANSVGNAYLSSFSPTFSYSSVIDNGYTVATSQPLQNSTITQAAINSGSYTETVTYQGSEQLPTASDLSFSNSNISMRIPVAGSQFIVANLNGVSYTSEIQALKNGSYNFGTVNPNTPNSIIIEIDYTAAQWNSVSGVPSFWSNPIGAIEYYWYIALGVLLGAIGLGAGIKGKAEGVRGVKK